MTLTAAIIAFIEADPTLAAKVTGRCYVDTLPQDPSGNAVVVRTTSLASWSTLQGATKWVDGRIRVSFWSAVAKDAEQMAFHFCDIIGSFNGKLGGSSGVGFKAYMTLGPIGDFEALTRYRGRIVDVKATINLADIS